MTVQLRRQLNSERLPLRKCLQCHEMKREDFHDRCHACQEMNRQYCQYQVESGVILPLDYNLIGWVSMTSLPGLNDYLCYFLKWCVGWKQPEMDRRLLRDERGRYMYPLWASVDVPLSLPQPKDENMLFAPADWQKREVSI